MRKIAIVLALAVSSLLVTAPAQAVPTHQTAGAGIASSGVPAASTASETVKADNAVARAEVLTIAKFIEAGIASGSITSKSPVKGPARLKDSFVGSIEVPRGFKARWNMDKGALCVQGRVGASSTWKFSHKTGQAVRGKC